MITTRFSPGLNGSLHLGHIFTLLVNEYVAHRAGGQFYVRFDDTSHSSTKSGRHKEVMHYQKKTIEWLEIEVDGWYKESELLKHVKPILDRVGFVPPYENELSYYLPHSLRMGINFIYYPYAPRQTAERVVMDSLTGITHVIRGEDFVTEFSYYSYVCQVMGFVVPEFWFLPRLASWNGDISKTNGGYTIAEYKKNGYSPDDIKDLLARSCLVNPANSWELYNIKPNPILIP